MRNFPVALVTGGSRGIGQGICLELARGGWGVVVNFRSDERSAEETANQCREVGSPWVRVVQGDVADLERTGWMVNEIVEDAGRLDLLVNNAGIASPRRADPLEVTSANWDTVLATNLKGPFFLSQHAARRMIALRRDETIERGTIVNISSISAYVASIERAEYCISKAGVSMMTQLWAHRLAPEGIYVFEVRPGIIRTDMTRPVADKYDRLLTDGLAPLRRWGTPRDVGLAVAALASGQFPYSTGEIVNVDGGFHSRRL